ncbi:bacillithiol system redox-active protein YtxJ [uncultured Flavobacterium sp.]|uniref:bacillithiol system redox-active protein YtxJ n=1 Tax=uncultured Flavobacterium sp. TaxID=165435 RepID=UPI0030CA5B49
MSLFSTVFGSSENQNLSNSKINWIPLTNLDQLDQIVTLSNEIPVVIFKHSTRCSISRFALKQFENEFDLDDKVDAYFLDLLEYRDISNEIASRFNAYHQSPQVLLIKSEKLVYNVSHSDIDATLLKEYL